MKRWLFNIVCLLALLLWVLTIAMWGRSYIAQDQFLVHRFEHLPGGTYWTYYHLVFGKGLIGFNRLQQSSADTDGKFESWILRTWSQPFHIAKSPQYPDFKFGPSKKYWGVEVGHFAHYDRSLAPNRPGAEGHLVIVPFWELLLAITLLGGPLWIYWYRTWKRYKPGLCPHCGYDLRASPDRCPECGKPTSSSIAQPEPSTAR
jgi:hypothetical protein